MSHETATVLVVDDDPSVRRSLARLIQAMGFAVETFGSANELLEREPFDGHGCLVLDLCMPGLTGLQLQEALAARESHVPVLFLTGHGDVPASVAAMKLGAVDFLQKPVEADVLEGALRSALERDHRQRRERLRARDARACVDSLTPREREVLEHVVAGEPNKQIGAALGIAEKTVKVHRGRVMDKMGVDSVAALVLSCQAAGVAPHGAISGRHGRT